MDINILGFAMNVVENLDKTMEEEKLKTLKETKNRIIEIIIKNTYLSVDDSVIIADEVLDLERAEAVKWVKKLQGEGWDEEIICNWVKHFFNLTEEDLGL